MLNTRKVRLLFLLRSAAWSLAFYIVLMVVLNWEDLGRKHEVVITAEQSSPHRGSSKASLSIPNVIGNHCYTVEENG